MSKTLKKVWLSALLAVLVLTCAAAIAFTHKTAKASSINVTINSGSDYNANSATGSFVQGGDKGFSFRFGASINSAMSGYDGASITVGPYADMTNRNQNGVFMLSIMFNGEHQKLFLSYYDSSNTTANPTSLGASGLYYEIMPMSPGGYRYFTVSVVYNTTTSAWELRVNDTAIDNGVFNSKTGSAFMNSSNAFNFTVSNPAVINATITIDQYTAISSSGSTPTTPTNPVTPEGAIVINSGSDYNANSATGSFVQGGGKGFSFRFGASINSAISGYNCASVTVGPYADMTNRSQNGVFMLSIMFNEEHQKLFLGYYDSTNTAAGNNPTTSWYDVISMTPGGYRYFTVSVVYNTTTSAWELRVNDTAIDNGVFNSKTGGAFMNSSNAFNFTVSNPANVNATITIDQFTAIGSSVVPVTPPPTVDPLGTVTINPGESYKAYETSGALIQGGDYGFSFRFGTIINSPVTGFPGAEILIGPEADLSNTSATGHFKLGMMYNRDNQGLYFSYTDNTGTERVKDMPIPGTLSTTDYLYITIAVEYNDSTNKWELKLNGTPVGGTAFNDNTGAAFMNSNHQFNMQVGNPAETKAVIVLDQFQVKGLCKVYFVVGGGLYEETEVRAGERITSKPADPVLEVAPDLTFDGWYYNGEKWNFTSDTVKGSMLLEAAFAETEIQEIDIDDGSSGKDPEGGSGENPGGDSTPSVVKTDEGGGCGGSIGIEVPLATLALTVVAAAMIIVKKRRA